MHKLTIAVLTFNRANYLKKMLDSIVLQTYKDFIVIIYDNCSQDNTEEAVKPYLSDTRFSYHKHTTNTENANFALSNCKTEYLLITHDDDIMLPDMVKEEISILDSHDDASMVWTNTNYINTDGKIIKTSVLSQAFNNQDFVIKNREYIKMLVRKGNTIACPTVMLRMSIIRENNFRFLSQVGKSNDCFMWLELNQLNYNFHYINKALYNYRKHDNQDSQQTLFLTPLLRKPVCELLLSNNYPKHTINSWLHYVNNVILIEIGRQPDRKKAFKTIEDSILLKNQHDFFFLMRIMYVIYMPLPIQKILYLPFRILKKILRSI